MVVKDVLFFQDYFGRFAGFYIFRCVSQVWLWALAKSSRHYLSIFQLTEAVFRGCFSTNLNYHLLFRTR